MALTQAVCSGLALSGDDAHAVRLAVEEACANVVHHGYRSRLPGPLGLEFRWTGPHTLQAHIHDQAPAFHPDWAPAPDVSSDTQDRPVGGLGWMLIRQLMPPVAYTSHPHGNTLVLQRQVGAGAP